MSGAVPRITNTQLQASVDALVMQVDRDTILGARKVLLTEANELNQAMVEATLFIPSTPMPGRMGAPGQGVWIGRCSDDPVSGPAQVSFNRKINAALEPCRKYIADLRLAGEQLADVARRYGITEDQIQADFRSAPR